MVKIVAMLTGGASLCVLGLMVFFAYQAEKNIPPPSRIVTDAINVGGIQSDAEGR